MATQTLDRRLTEGHPSRPSKGLRSGPDPEWEKVGAVSLGWTLCLPEGRTAHVESLEKGELCRVRRRDRVEGANRLNHDVTVTNQDSCESETRRRHCQASKEQYIAARHKTHRCRRAELERRSSSFGPEQPSEAERAKSVSHRICMFDIKDRRTLTKFPVTRFLMAIVMVNVVSALMVSPFWRPRTDERRSADASTRGRA